MKKNLIIVSLNYGGGVGSFLKNIIDNFYDKFNVVLVSNNGEAKTYFKDYEEKVSFLDIKPNKILPYTITGINLNNIKKKLNANGYENNVYFLQSYAILGLLHSYNNENIILVNHGHMINGGFQKVCAKKIFKKHQNVKYVSVSDETKQYFKDNFNLESKVIYNGVDVVANRDKQQEFTVGYVGNMDFHKGYKYLIDAAEILKNKGKYNIKFIFVGGCAEEDQLNRIEKLKAEGVSIKYLGKVKDANKKVIPKLDTLVLPSKMEGLPMTLIEAQSLGIPILATNVGGIPEVLEDNVNGLFITRDGDNIAENIIRILDKDTYNKFETNSISIYKSKFTIDEMLKDYFALFMR